MEQLQLFITDDFKCKTPFESLKDFWEKRELRSCYKTLLYLVFHIHHSVKNSNNFNFFLRNYLVKNNMFTGFKT